MSINLNSIDLTTTSIDLTTTTSIDLTSASALSSLPSRELEEARCRLDEMEKSLRWWTDCSSNWRNKWTKAYAERNRSRDECKKLLKKLYYLETCDNDNNKEHRRTSASAANKHQAEKDIKEDAKECETMLPEEDTPDNDSKSNGTHSTVGGDEATKPDSDKKKNGTECHPSDHIGDQDYKLQSLKLSRSLEDHKCDNAKLLDDLNSAQKKILSLNSDNNELTKRLQYFENRIKEMKSHHADEIKQFSIVVDDESKERIENKEMLAKLRTQIETLQTDNGAEWRRAEAADARLTEITFTLKRSSNDLEEARSDFDKLRDSSERANDANQLSSSEIYRLHEELNDHRIQTSRQRKQLEDTRLECCHMTSRVEAYDGEMRLLRSKVTEVKLHRDNFQDLLSQELLKTRKLQRDNDDIELKQECLQLEYDELKARLRSKSKSPYRTALTQDSRSSSLQSFEANEVSLIDEGPL